jgi:cell division protease FtsH
MIALTLIQIFVFGPMAGGDQEISYSEFKTALTDGEIASVDIGVTEITGEFVGNMEEEPKVFTTVRVEDPGLIDDLESEGVEVRGVVESEFSLMSILGWLLPVGLMIAFYYVMMKRMRGSSGGSGSGLFTFGKSKAKVIRGEQSGVTFSDVGGAGQAVMELREVTEFLKHPERYERLGGKMPKGVLLYGPPGTGKTLLARAAAGEADVPFFSLSAAEFIEMFVGVGASRVRDLFDQAKKQAPSIIFIDEIDAIGGQRGGVNVAGRNEEREQTLNQLLAEMDGFEPNTGVVVMAATNRPEMLDPALLRPGRFDRQVAVDLPDIRGRTQILQIHTREVVLGEDVEAGTLARITPGFSGADLANLVNEAALIASRRGKDSVEMGDFDAAFERVVAGSERSTGVMNTREKEIVAYHEAGHALVASLLSGADPVHKVSIVPRGRALGYTMHRPTEDRYLLSESELHDRLTALLGGRVAEAIIFGLPSTGAADDLTRATDLARRMVTEYGMSTLLGPVRLADNGSAYVGPSKGLDSRVSPKTAALVDEETKRIVEHAVDRAWQLLEDNRGTLEAIAGKLCEQETLDARELEEILAVGQDRLAVEETDKPIAMEA